MSAALEAGNSPPLSVMSVNDSRFREPGAVDAGGSGNTLLLTKSSIMKTK